MGYSYTPEGQLYFLSKKLPLLKRAVGQTVWVVQGEPAGRSTCFTLVGRYIAENIAVEDKASGLYVLFGSGMDAPENLGLNSLPWFAKLKKSQSNFSLGFNTINDSDVINALDALLPLSTPTSANEDSATDWSAEEGAKKLRQHFARERDQQLITQKKETVLKEHKRLACEICGFDFQAVYGEIGKGFCEVHHLKPLGKRNSPTTTALSELAIVCANCHRMIHRRGDCLDIEILRQTIRKPPTGKS